VSCGGRSVGRHQPNQQPTKQGVKVMSEKEIRRKFKQTRKLARHIADRCDFVTAERIGKASASFGKDFVIVCVAVKDQVEVAQVVCAYVYGATLTGLNFHRSALDDIEHAGGRIVAMTLGCGSEVA
jgi:hypothetical protein